MVIFSPYNVGDHCLSRLGADYPREGVVTRKKFFLPLHRSAIGLYAEI